MRKALRSEFRLRQKFQDPGDFWKGISKGFEAVRLLNAEWALAQEWHNIFAKEVQNSWPTREMAAMVLITRLAKHEHTADHKLRKTLDLAVEMFHDKMDVHNTECMERQEIETLNLKVLNEVFFDDLGFRVNPETFNDPENTFLDTIIDRRVGIPISLSVLYMSIAKSLGIEMAGLGLPSRFIMTYQKEHKSQQPIFIDSYTKGAFLTPSDCTKIIRRAITREQIPYPLGLERYRLEPAGVVLRMLSNLRAFAKGEEFDYWQRNIAIVRMYLDKDEPGSAPEQEAHDVEK